MRMFVAVRPPPAAVEDLDEFLDVRRAATSKGGDALRWSLPEQLHVTLTFLAEVPERRLEDLEARLERAARKRTAFSTRIAGGGAFPNAERARVLWAGLDLTDDNHEELRRLATGARASANRAGITVDGQRFRPHITVARIGRPTEVTNWVRLLDSYAGPEWSVHDIELVASHLGEGPRGRPRYETVAVFPLIPTK